MALGWAVLALAWLAGVALQLQQAHLGPWAAVLVPGLATAMLLLMALMGAHCWPAWRAWRGLLIWLLAATLVGLGAWALTQWRAQQRWQQQWPVGWAKQEVMITGRLAAMPQVQPWGVSLLVDVQAVEASGVVCRPGQHWPSSTGAAKASVCPERVLLRWAAVPGAAGASGGGPRMRPGQVWRWAARLHQPDGLSNPGAYDAELAQFERGVRAVGSIRPGHLGGPGAPTMVQPEHWRDGQVIERWRTDLRDRVLGQLSDPQVAGLVIGLTVGDQSAISANDWEAMRLTGTAHLAAISGLHVTMMGWLISLLVGGVWRCSRRLTQWRATPVVAFWAGLAGAVLYALLSGWGVPAQRTVWMLAVITVLRVGGRRWPWPLGLLLAAVVVTLLDPWALLQAGFWLSFAAVGLLMVSGGDEADPHADQGPWHARWGQAALNAARTQWVAFVGLAPLSLVFFQSFSQVGLLANVVCIPLFTLVITPLAMLGLAWPTLWAWLTPVVHHTMALLSEMGAQPWALWQGQGVSLWAAMLGLLAGAWMLAPLPWRWRLMALPCMLPLLWPNSLSLRWMPPPLGQVAMVAADIGQGTAVLVQTAHHVLLFDTGPRLSPEMDAGKRVLVGLFRTLGIQRLDALVLSHGDADHIGGAASVLKALPVRQLVSSLVADHELLTQPDHDGHLPAHQPCLAGQHWQWDGVNFAVLHPTAQDYAERDRLGDNALSCVLRVEAAGQVALLTGDIEKAQEAALVARLAGQLRSDVLVVPHHGSQTSSTPDFLAQVQPQVAVIQAGARNRYGHPNPKVLARYQALGIAVQASPDCGAWVWRSGHAASALGQCWRVSSRHYWFHPPTVPALALASPDPE